MLDAVVVGSGPNGLSAAITLAQAGLSTVIYESSESVGGGTRSRELTLPGFVHDICSAIHPLALASPFFRRLPLEKYGLKWIHPDIPLASPFDEGRAAVACSSLGETIRRLSSPRDRESYERLFRGLGQELLDDLLALPSKIPKNVAALGSFVFNAISPVKSFANKRFEGEDARALFGGCAAHSMLPLNKHLTTGYATVMLILAHTFGWPFPRGGAQKLADALAAYLASLGGRIETGFNVTTLDSLPRAKAIFLDVTPKQALGILGSSLPMWYTRSLGSFRYGPGVFKVDYALDGPIPWKAEECLGAGTVHVGGSLKEIAISEEEVSRGIVPERPFIILAQQSLFDDSRAPDGKQALWAYCHAPSGSNFDLSKRIEAQIERFAPGFTRRILKKHSLSAVELERYNANYVGGDINGGVQDLWQTISRPVLSLCPYRTPLRGVYLCSSSTPPGGGVHGMCGYLAAKAALSREFAIS